PDHRRRTDVDTTGHGRRLRIGRARRHAGRLPPAPRPAPDQPGRRQRSPVHRRRAPDPARPGQHSGPDGRPGTLQPAAGQHPAPEHRLRQLWPDPAERRRHLHRRAVQNAGQPGRPLALSPR
ncbi:conserved hypothetical protein, partial [Ricinus communis]